jgi:DNA-binding CsgD family transcriptional regulator
MARRVLSVSVMTNAALVLPSTTPSEPRAYAVSTPPEGRSFAPSSPAPRPYAASIFDDLPAAMLVVDDTGRVLDANAAARSTLAAGRGLAVQDGMVRCTGPGRQRALMELVVRACAPDTSCRGACADDASRASSALSLGAICGRVSPVVLVTPARGRALLILVDPARSKPSVEPRTLEALLGLTPAEARVVAHLAAGLSLEQVCALLDISIATGRTHLRHVFDKTGTGRQGELISVVLGSLGWPAVAFAVAPPAPAR